MGEEEWEEPVEVCKKCGTLSSGDYVVGNGLCEDCDRKEIDEYFSTLLKEKLKTAIDLYNKKIDLKFLDMPTESIQHELEKILKKINRRDY